MKKLKKMFSFVLTLLSIAFMSIVFLSSAKSGELPMLKIPETYVKILRTEVNQELYQSIMGSNPSDIKSNKLPVVNVSWYDAIYFCNKLSSKAGLELVYKVNGSNDVSKWNYTPHQGKSINGEITWDYLKNGYRLLTSEEWEFAANGNQDFKYAGSDNLEEIGWSFENSEGTIHPVGQKKSNGYGLFDMCGNVSEWVWDSYGKDFRCVKGSSFLDPEESCTNEEMNIFKPCEKSPRVGFRILCRSASSSSKGVKFKKSDMIKIPGKKIKMLKTEVPQSLFESVMGYNPSSRKNYNLCTFRIIEDYDYPVEKLDWYEAMIFCNRMSVKHGLTPVYSINGSTDSRNWNYSLFSNFILNREKVTQNLSADGYRLPTVEEWIYAAKGGQEFNYAGDFKLANVAWFDDNSEKTTHPVAQKKPNAYGLYDMNGNVYEWVWDIDGLERNICGGCCVSPSDFCNLNHTVNKKYPDHTSPFIGFRVVCNSD